MNTTMNSPPRFSLKLIRLARAGCALSLLLLAGSPLRAAEAAQSFATPEEAVNALASALKAKDSPALRSLFGSAADELVNPDQVQAKNEFTAFAAALSQTNRLARESDTRRVLEVGTNRYPFSVPIVQKDGRWFFDAAAGKDEMLNRRIGHNELSTLSSVRAYVGAQREYASKDRDGDEVLEFAQKFLSTPGKKDGLFWPPDLDGELSPLGPLVAQAQTKGYFRDPQDPAPAPEPFHGYYFKILTRQGKHAPGGKHDFIINGNMIAGFALVAWPAGYGESGIMTFIVNQQGRVFQKDLGPNTPKTVEAMKEYDPDKTWTVSAD